LNEAGRVAVGPEWLALRWSGTGGGRTKLDHYDSGELMVVVTASREKILSLLGQRQAFAVGSLLSLDGEVRVGWQLFAYPRC
jgi:hypothetical protein